MERKADMCGLARQFRQRGWHKIESLSVARARETLRSARARARTASPPRQAARSGIGVSKVTAHSQAVDFTDTVIA